MCKTFLQLRKVTFIFRTSQQCKVYGRRWKVHTGPDSGTLVHMCSEPHNVGANLETRKLFGLCVRQAVYCQVDGCHVLVRYPVRIKDFIPGWPL